jgi:hypothetical protein
MDTELMRDVMQVCLGGHVITDVLASHPEQGVQHCDRCGAPTISRCPTCGDDLAGAAPLPGLSTIGQRQAPQHCSCCGAAFPWAQRPAPAEASNTLDMLETVLRRLPHAVRQLRDRHDGRPTVRIVDAFDLEDLMRAILHLHFDDVRRETRTPGYSFGTRTDFVVGPQRIAVTAKLARPDVREQELVRQIHEDAAFYERKDVECLVVLIYDPEQIVRDAPQFEAAWLRAAAGPEIRCVVASR